MKKNKWKIAGISIFFADVWIGSFLISLISKGHWAAFPSIMSIGFIGMLGIVVFVEGLVEGK